jgi:copper(I)-binding protein
MRGARLLSVLLLAVSVGEVSCHEPPDASHVTVLDARAYPSPKDEEHGALLLVDLVSRGRPAGLVSGRLEDGDVKLRTHAFEQGRRTTPVIQELALPEGLAVRMHPEGVFFEVTELAEPVQPGETLDFVLILHDRSEVPVEVPVKRLPRAKE